MRFAILVSAAAFVLTATVDVTVAAPPTCREDHCEEPTPVAEARQKLAEIAVHLRKGNSRRVVIALQSMYTNDARVDAEIELIAAAAGVRSGMDVVRSQNPAKTIRLAFEADPRSARLQALYAESLLRGNFSGRLATAAAGAKRNADALRLLTQLESRGQIPDAHAWAALARAQRLAGAKAKADAALAACSLVAVTAAVCAS